MSARTMSRVTTTDDVFLLEHPEDRFETPVVLLHDVALADPVAHEDEKDGVVELPRGQFAHHLTQDRLRDGDLAFALGL